jgi:tetraacyldisaccharide 4'-kinase
VAPGGGGGGPAEPLRELAGRPCFRGRRRPEALVEAGAGRRLPPEALRGRKVCAFAGIGTPGAFRASLASLGAEVAAFRAFADHHPYGPGDVEALRRLAAEEGAGLVTTEKDAVRLADFPEFLAELSFLRIAMEIDPREAFAGLIFKALRIKQDHCG